MFVIVKFDIENNVLVPGQTIFLRPTPWKVAWQAGFDYVRRTGCFCFVYLPAEYSQSACNYRLERGKDLAIFHQSKEIARIPLLALSFWRWFFYGVESFAYGFFERFWLWRWDARPSRQELEAMIERLEQQIQELLEQH